MKTNNLVKAERRSVLSSVICRVCTVVLVFTVICNVFFYCIYARYINQNSVSASTPINNYVFDVSASEDGTQSLNLNLEYMNFVPGQGYSENWFVFYVTNKGNCDVEQKYTIKTENMDNVRIGYKLVYEGDEKGGEIEGELAPYYSEVVNKDENGADIGTLASGLPIDEGVTTISGVMPAGEVALHKYVMRIYARAEKDDKHYSNAGKIDWVTITVSSEQTIE